MSRVPFALQLYTVRDHMEKDPAGTLERVKEAGYDRVELAGTAGMSAAEFKKLLDTSGLTPISAHVGLNEMAANLAPVLDDLNALGVKFCAFSGNASDRQGWLDVADQATDVGGRLRQAGVRLCYHNHAHEFEKYDGEYALDILLDRADAKCLEAQIDVYWAQYGGVDPVGLIRKYAGRCPLIHMKDMSADGSRTFAEVGRGVIDMPAVLSAAAAAGAQWYIVEQDICPGDSIESARISAEYLAAQTL